MKTPASASDWSRMLKEYSFRNAGRLTRLACDDPDVEAQWSEVAFPLRGITYDGLDDRIEILLGETGSLESRLTHSIRNPISIDFTNTGPAGGERLRITHGNGRTRLEFE